MKSLRILLPGIVVLVTMLMSACSDDENNYKQLGTANNTNRNLTTANAHVGRLEFPHLKGGGSVVVVHSGVLNQRTGERGVNYSVEWDPAINAQRWSCYQMYKGVIQQNTTRYTVKNGPSLTPDAQYPNDTFLGSSYWFTTDPYWNSGYDHGHICPSADRLGASEANYQTFFLTNMQPQVNAFNAGIWESMESQVRKWSNTNDTIYVCKGGTIDRSDHIVKYLGSGRNKIPVPKYFFMALLAKNAQGYKAIAFWVQHNGSIDPASPLTNYVKSIRELEALTDIDFFCNLPDDVEEQVETIALDNMKRAWGMK